MKVGLSVIGVAYVLVLDLSLDVLNRVRKVDVEGEVDASLGLQREVLVLDHGVVSVAMEEVVDLGRLTSCVFFLLVIVIQRLLLLLIREEMESSAK